MFIKMSDSQIIENFNEIEEIWNKHLKHYGVKQVRLRTKEKFTKNALVLTYLYHKRNQVVTKSELTRFLSYKNQPSSDVQQARHLARQSGWNILSGTRPDIMPNSTILKSGEYTIVDLTIPYNSYSSENRRSLLNDESFEEIKKEYSYRCSSCGSKEDEPEFRNPSRITKLQKGHMNPREDLIPSNVIPQCESCNRASRDNFIFDRLGRIDAINNADFFFRSPDYVIEKALKIFVKNYKEEILNLLKLESE